MATSQELMEGIKRQRDLVVSLRQQVLDLNKHVQRVYKQEENGAANGDVEEARAEFRKCSEQLERTFEGLETDTQQMLKMRDRWNTPEMNRLNTFLLDALADPNNAELYEKALKLTNTRETMETYIKYTLDFLKLYGGSTNRHRRQPRISAEMRSSMSHEQLEAALKPLAEYTQKGRFRYRWLEQNAFGGLLEVRQVHAQHVDLVKMGFVVHNGAIDHVQFLATHEDWTFREENRKQVDLSVQSKYDYFRRLNALANNTWLPSLSGTNTASLSRCIMIFSSFPNFEHPCRNCKKFLKNFAPAIMEKSHERYIHDACK